MHSRSLGLERVLLALFIASGFAGLIYQAIWSHYLGLSLGHAAYAQTLVLAIFMGGMAIGAWLVSRRGIRWRRLILAYALVEIVIGLAGLAFHPVFVAYTGFSQDAVYPALSSPASIRAWQWGSAALLIAPQSILLGMTFPLMSGGYLRVAPRADGEILGGLYFTNSIGAAAGALFATFVLLPWVGMPGAVAFAGALNLLVGVLAWLASRRADARAGDGPAVAAPGNDGRGGVGRGFYTMMLAAACITGASSFVYEIGWVRMLNQALGTTVHSFELMLAAFILGLAFGGLWIRKRSQAIGDAVAYAGYAQVWMGMAALVSLPVFAQSFHWVGALLQAVPRTDAGYAAFSLGSAAIALLVMFPAAFFAGMTLPLFTMALLRKGAGEAGIGRIYAANTLGAILGVALAVHVLIPAFGLHLAVTLAALADIALGFVLLRMFAEQAPKSATYHGAALASVMVLAVSVLFGRADPRALASGVFRTGESTLATDISVDYLRDGKTASVAVISGGSWRAIATNGKPDAGMDMDPAGEPADDEITMLMLGSLPLALHREPKRVGVIGWGSGLTTHTLLGSQLPERVDSIEIEGAMVEGAMLFGHRVARAYQDPRSQLHIDDARTYFSTGRIPYDVIVSEPSNPWVSGVASLFTHQFYRFLSSHLDKGGVVIQWVHLYELDDGLLARMLAALVQEFPHVEVYAANDSDLLIAASLEPLPPLAYPAPEGSPFEAELKRVGLVGAADFQVRRLGDRALLDAMVRLSGVPAHDDFHPVISLEAPKARFKNSSATWMLQLQQAGLPVLELTSGRTPIPSARPLADVEGSAAVRSALNARQVRSRFVGEGGHAGVEDEALAAAVEDLRRLSGASLSDEQVDEWFDAAFEVSEATLSELTAEDAVGLWIEPVWLADAARPAVVDAVMAAYAATARRDPLAMSGTATAALDAVLAGGHSQAIAEQMLVIARLGELAAGNAAKASDLERQYGRQVPIRSESNYGFTRAFLLAWADRPEVGASAGP